MIYDDARKPISCISIFGPPSRPRNVCLVWPAMLYNITASRVHDTQHASSMTYHTGAERMAAHEDERKGSTILVPGFWIPKKASFCFVQNVASYVRRSSRQGSGSASWCFFSETNYCPSSASTCQTLGKMMESSIVLRDMSRACKLNDTVIYHRDWGSCREDEKKIKNKTALASSPVICRPCNASHHDPQLPTHNIMISMPLA